MFSDYIQNIAMVVIFAGFLGLILPRGKYRDYVKLITGLVVILAVISPAAGFFTGRSLEDFFEEAQRQIRMDIARGAISGGHTGNNTMLQAVLEEYRAGLSAQLSLKISNLGYEVEEARIYIDESNENFGRITGLSLVLSEKPEEEGGGGLIRVERVSLSSIDIGISIGPAENTDRDESPEIIAVKNLLSDFYNLSVENINIRVIHNER